MSRYEKINYEELELMAVSGGAENEVMPQRTKDAICRILSKAPVSVVLTKNLCPAPKTVGCTCTVVKPIDRP